jgi:hypothetical protein
MIAMANDANHRRIVVQSRSSVSKRPRPAEDPRLSPQQVAIWEIAQYQRRMVRGVIILAIASVIVAIISIAVVSAS